MEVLDNRETYSNILEDSPLYTLSEDKKEILLPDLQDVTISSQNSRHILTILLSRFDPNDQEQIPIVSTTALSNLFYEGYNYPDRMAKNRVCQDIRNLNKFFREQNKDWCVKRIVNGNGDSTRTVYYGLFYIGNKENLKAPTGKLSPIVNKYEEPEDYDDNLDMVSEKDKVIYERVKNLPADTKSRQLDFVFLAIQHNISIRDFKKYIEEFIKLGDKDISRKKIMNSYEQSSNLREFLFYNNLRFALDTAVKFSHEFNNAKVDSLFEDCQNRLRAFIRDYRFEEGVDQNYTKWAMEFSISTYILNKYYKTPERLYPQAQIIKRLITLFAKENGRHPTFRELSQISTKDSSLKPSDIREVLPFIIPHGALPQEALHEAKDQKPRPTLFQKRRELRISRSQLAEALSQYSPDIALDIIECLEKGEVSRFIKENELPYIYSEIRKVFAEKIKSIKIRTLENSTEEGVA